MIQLTLTLGISVERFELRHSGVTQWATRQQKIGGKLVADGGWLLPPSAPPPSRKGALTGAFFVEYRDRFVRMKL